MIDDKKISLAFCSYKTSLYLKYSFLRLIKLRLFVHIKTFLFSYLQARTTIYVDINSQEVIHNLWLSDKKKLLPSRLNIINCSRLHDDEKQAALLMFDHRRGLNKNIIKRHFFEQFYALLRTGIRYWRAVRKGDVDTRDDHKKIMESSLASRDSSFDEICR